MTTIQISESGRYENVFIEDSHVASYDKSTGEFVVYDPHNDSEDPEVVFRP